MKKDEALETLTKELGFEIFDEDAQEAINKGIKALELIGHLKDRPCEACEFHKKNGCCKWDCVFEEMIYE